MSEQYWTNFHSNSVKQGCDIRLLVRQWRGRQTSEMWPKCGRGGGYATLGPVTLAKLFMRKYFMWRTFANLGEKCTPKIQHNNISSNVQQVSAS